MFDAGPFQNRFIPTRVGNTPLGQKKRVVVFGSSPRVWGIRGGRTSSGSINRFIPTRVGNTHQSPYSWNRVTVHPHACGEYPAAECLRYAVRGSSPRVWGIRVENDPVLRALRFIPTRVGNTGFGQFLLSGASVHPHACGEYGVIADGEHVPPGSSPRVWGILVPNRAEDCVPRFIPTRVGNTVSVPRMPEFWTVHPHACGEYGDRAVAHVRCAGSSPRVWGIRISRRFHGQIWRFIPTRVGNTRPFPVRAEWPSGSSPRVWGIPKQSASRTPRGRFIPTRVGNTAPVTPVATTAPVHPHACGEYTSSISLSYRK